MTRTVASVLSALLLLVAAPQSAHEWLVEISGTCAGVLIAPTAVLTTATCATQAFETGVKTVQVWRRSDMNAPHERRSRIPIAHDKDAGLHEMFARGHAKFDFAVIKLAEAAPGRPVLLLSSSWDGRVGGDGHLWQSPLQVHGTQDVRSGESKQVAYNASEATDVRPQQQQQKQTSPAHLVRVTVNESCAALHPLSPDAGKGAGPTFLVAHARDNQFAGLLGVAPGFERACRDVSGQSASQNTFVRVSALQKFIDASSSGHHWVPLPTASDVRDKSSSGSSANAGDSRLNSTSSSSSSRQDATGNTDSGDVQVPEDLGRPNRHYRPDVTSAIGMMSVEDDVSARFGPPIVLIAPTFALTRAHWISESCVFEGGNATNETIFAAFEGEAIQVKQLIYEREPSRADDDGENGDLVLLELASAAAVPPMSLFSTMPVLEVASTRMTLEVFDSLVGPDDETDWSGTLRHLPLSICDTNRMLSLDTICVNVPRINPFSPTHRLVALNQGIVRIDGHLVGFSSTNASVASSELYDQFEVFDLAWPSHVEFLHSATRSTCEWSSANATSAEDDATADDPSDSQPYIVSFVAPDDGDIAVCQGILVAPKFVLTTVSCAHEHSITAISFSVPNLPVILAPYSPNATIVHPRYNKTAPPAERFDVAILPLAFATDVTPAKLSLGGANQNDSLLAFRKPTLVRGFVRAQGPQLPVQLHQAANCSASRQSGNATHALFRTSLCLKPAPSSGDVVMPEGSQFFKGQNPLIGYSQDPDRSKSSPLDKSVIGRALDGNSSTSRRRGYSVVGFAFADSGGDGSEVYSVTTLADVAVFINAYVTGSSWEAGGVMIDGSVQIAKRFIVGLRVAKASQNFCGGSLIAPTYVLTAAHCVTDGLANWVSIGAKLSSGTAPEAIQVIKRSVVIHKNYGDPSKFSFDAAIFEIASAAYAEPVILDQSPDFTSGEMATMYGYGVTTTAASTRSASGATTTSSNEKTALSTEIRAVDLSLMSQEQCTQTLPEIDRSMLCAVGKNGADACQGDSGGPLVLPDQGGGSGKDVLVGFVSAGYECGLKNVPGIYMRVSSLASFIKDNTAGAQWSTSIASPPPSPATPPSNPSPTISNPELRDLDSLTPRESVPSSTKSGDAHSTTTTAPTSVSAQTSKAPIRFTDLSSNVSPQVRNALLLFLLGVSDTRNISLELLERLTSESNTVRFFSTADLATLLATIKRHNDKPLYARTDRFGRHKSAQSLQSADSRISNVCTV